MMEIILNYVLLIVNIATFVITVLFAIFGIYEYIRGPEKAEQMLEIIHFPLNYRQTLFVGFANLVIMIISYIWRKHFL